MSKQILLTLTCLAFSFVSYSQQIGVIVNSPASIAGSYTYTASNPYASIPPFFFWGTDITTGTWTADAVLVENSIPPLSVGCDSLVNGADLAGKIAIMDENQICQFGKQSLNAQNAGAIACLIINYDNEFPYFMGPGAFGAEVTIPVVLVSQADGELIKAELANGPVNMTIGSVTFANDIGSLSADIGRVLNGVMPAQQSTPASNSFIPSAQVTNYGEYDASNVVLNVEINYTPSGGGAATMVHIDAKTLPSLEVGTSAIISMDNGYAAAAGIGTYSVTYSISSDSTDNYSLDNELSFDYSLTENAFAKGRWDSANNRTYANIAPGFVTGKVEYAVGFPMPLGKGFQLDSIKFFAAAGPPNFYLGGLGADNLISYVYEWDDTDEDGVVTNDEITIVALGFIEEFSNPALSADWIKMPLFDIETSEPGYIVPENDKTYLVGVRYTGPDVFAIGFDINYNQKFFFDNIPITATITESPHILINSFDGNNLPLFDNFGISNDFPYPIAISLMISPVTVNSISKVNPAIGSFEIYPNPVSDFLQVETTLANSYEEVTYTVLNNQGQIMSSITKNIVGQIDNATLNVSRLPAGLYFLNVNTVDGSINQAFVLQR